MRFVLTVTGPAYGTQQASSAFLFAQALLDSGHQLMSVFFYREGVYNANQLVSPASDEFDLVRSWQLISIKFNVKLNVCISAALRRGIIASSEAKRLGLECYNLEKNFLLSGLGSFVKDVLICDRMVQF